MSNVPSDTPRSFRHKIAKTSVEVDGVANAASIALGFHDEEQAFELPARLFEQLPFVEV